MKDTGKFVVSLDFELMWGVRDLVTTQTYGQHLLGVQQALPGILSAFSKYQIKGTFATVGFLFFQNKNELLQHLPASIPAYAEKILSPYGDYLQQDIGQNEEDDPYHFGLHLIQLIQNTPGQEIGTHTFSHYYCLENGQTETNFRDDLKAAIDIAQKRGIKITSIIFPRNQVNDSYLNTCKEFGIIAYRNNQKSWIYHARSGKQESLVRRAVRLLDAYVNISGHHCYTHQYMGKCLPVNIPGSRFLRPYTNRLRWLENLRLNRIKKSMTYAAKNNLMYHLWWHPHNFGINQAFNFAFLEKILEHYLYLNNKYAFTSYTMSELAQEILKEKK
ncbi:MAG: polysaccharide deacetylase family protein [Bacteroidetes bacterium]|nr:polysaccharide deacetylase family protein [Bacteroidota bacterium]MBS1758112.1 polysaccharide deacetylase family protein [Bacteroidota bacterium]